jgi:hypothetical protein
MASRERQCDKRPGTVTRRLSWPAVVLAGRVLLSLAANLARPQLDAWGRIVAAVPPAAFLVAVSMIERRAARRPRRDGRPRCKMPGTRHCSRSRGGPPPGTRTSAGSSGALRARLGVSSQAASGLLRQLRSGQGRPPGAARAPDLAASLAAAARRCGLASGSAADVQRLRPELWSRAGIQRLVGPPGLVQGLRQDRGLLRRVGLTAHYHPLIRGSRRPEGR